MCKSFRSAPTFAHRSANYIRSCVKAFSLSQKPSTHLRIGKIPSRKQAFRGNFANPRFVRRYAKQNSSQKLTQRMITKVNLNQIASYKKLTTLETDKKVNLIYGLNGTGKSTLSNYLNQRTDDKYKSCSVEGLDDTHDILVYNQAFIQENFFEAENLKGIFTLSKENKEAETKIANALK